MDRRDPETAWRFWESLVMKNGVLDLEQLKKELADWYYVMEQVPQVYATVTGGLLSKVTYEADSVIRAFEDYLTREIDDAVDERIATLREVVDAQAEDELLWSVPMEGLQSVAEAHLQEELRRLHEAIELIG